jgi:hypothetical protein
MTREVTKAERAATKLRVVGSLQADNGKDTHHGVYSLRTNLKRCPKCGAPHGLIFCVRCHGSAA